MSRRRHRQTSVNRRHRSLARIKGYGLITLACGLLSLLFHLALDRTGATEQYLKSTSNSADPLSSTWNRKEQLDLGKRRLADTTGYSYSTADRENRPAGEVQPLAFPAGTGLSEADLRNAVRNNPEIVSRLLSDPQSLSRMRDLVAPIP